MNELRVKGHGLTGMLSAITVIEGEAVRSKVEARLPDDLRDALRLGAVVAGGFYPIGWARAIHERALEEGSKGAQLPFLIGYESTKKDLQGIYAFVAKMFNPGTVLGQGKRLMAMYYGGGTADVLERSSTSATLRYRECFGFDRAMFEELAGGSVAIMEACGGRNAQADIRSVSSAAMEAAYRWE
ncbi:MAG: hypothetical protein U0269_32600 [Polyangiales bacterium]